MASVSTAALAQVSAGGALDAAGSVSAEAGSTSVDAGASTNANANASGNSSGSTGANASGSTNANGSVTAGGSNNGSNGSLNAAASGSAAANGSLNYGSIISDLNTSTTTAADIEGLGSDVQIDVVTLSELRGNAGENANALDQAVTAQGSGMADLRIAIESNSGLRGEIDAALNAEGDFTLEDVVSISTSAEGHLILVVDDAE
jgi:hypothetical protein